MQCEAKNDFFKVRKKIWSSSKAPPRPQPTGAGLWFAKSYTKKALQIRNELLVQAGRH